MKALTLTQPWASAVAKGIKAVETRSWSTPYRGWMAIHAAKGWKIEDREFALEEAFRFLEMYPEDYPRGAVVAVAKVTRIEPAGQAKVSDIERLFGVFETGRFAWFLDEVYEFAKPVPAVGKQGLWDLPAGVENEMRAQRFGTVSP